MKRLSNEQLKTALYRLIQKTSLIKPKSICQRLILMFVLLVSICGNNTATAQIVVAGTSFDPLVVDPTKTTYGYTEVQQYGIQGGTINVPAPLTPNKLNTSPFATENDILSTATLYYFFSSINTFLKFLTNIDYSLG